MADGVRQSRAGAAAPLQADGLGGGGYAIYEVVPRAWTLLFAEMVERPDLAADVNDPTTVVPDAQAQERVWTALRRDLRVLGEVHGIDFSLPPSRGRSG